jgi:hypothetical protein
LESWRLCKDERRPTKQNAHLGLHFLACLFESARGLFYGPWRESDQSRDVISGLGKFSLLQAVNLELEPSHSLESSRQGVSRKLFHPSEISCQGRGVDQERSIL